jgi:hypothetical protein
MRDPKRYVLTLILVAACTSLSSCNSNLTESNVDNSVSTTANSISTPKPQLSPSTAQLRDKSRDEIPSPQESPGVKAQSTNTDTSNNDETVKVTVYTSDDQCQQLVGKQTEVSQTEPMKDAVGKILKEVNTADINLSGYRLQVKEGVATVDLRLSPGSKRQLASLSSCEQMALFGSLRKTLTSNAQWKIKDVRFTERGEEIVL